MTALDAETSARPLALPIPQAAFHIAAAGLGLLATGLAWTRPYMVDYEVALLPWLLSRGWVLYRDLADQHPPLFPALLAVLTGGGNPGWPLHLFIVALLALTLALTYAVGTRLAGAGAGLVALALAALWLAVFDSTHLWYDTALGPLYLAVLLLLAWRPHPPALALGLLLGIGLLLKQHAALAVPCVAVALILAGPGWRRQLAWFAAGLGGPLLVAGAALAAQGGLADAWYWVVAFTFDSDYASQAAQPPAPGSWPVLYGCYALALVLLLGVLAGGRRVAPGRRGQVGLGLAGAGMLLAATLPAWPRYGPVHLHAAIPLLAVAGGVGTICLVRSAERGLRNRSYSVFRRPSSIVHRLSSIVHHPRDPHPALRILQAALGLLLLGWSTVVGAGAWAAGVRVQALIGPPAAPYATTLAPLRAWVDAHAPAGAPIVVYDLDPLLYRVLEREPPRPWAPQLPWILHAHDTEARRWAGMVQARVPVIVVSAGGWDASPEPGPSSGEARLRYDYHEVVRFPLVIYRLAPPVMAAGLLPNDGATR